MSDTPTKQPHTTMSSMDGSPAAAGATSTNDGTRKFINTPTKSVQPAATKKRYVENNNNSSNDEPTSSDDNNASTSAPAPAPAPPADVDNNTSASAPAPPAPSLNNDSSTVDTTETNQKMSEDLEINTKSIRDDVLKVGPTKKKKKNNKKKKNPPPPPPNVSEFSIFNNCPTPESIDVQLGRLDGLLSRGNYADALEILDDLIDKYPNKQLVNVKLQYAIITLKSQPTPQQLDKALHMLLRCIWQSQYDNGICSTDDKINLLDQLISKICSKQIASEHRADEYQTILNCLFNAPVDAHQLINVIHTYETAGNYSSALVVSLAANISGTHVNCINIARQAIEINEANDDTSLLFEALIAVEHSLAKVLEKGDTSSDAVSSHIRHRMLILNQLIKSTRLSTLSFMSFYCSMEMCEMFFDRTQSSSPEIRDMMKEANKLMDDKIVKVEIDTDLSGVVKLMRECMIGKGTIQAANDLMNLDDKALESNEIKKQLKKWAVLLNEASVHDLNYTSTDDFSETISWFNNTYDDIYFKLYDAIAATESSVEIKAVDIDGSEIIALAKKQKYTPNMSDGLNKFTRTCIYKNWASPSCNNYDDPREPYKSKVDRGNGCIAAFLNYMIFNITSENGVSVTDDILDKHDDATVFIDDHVDVVNNKSVHKEEHKALEEDIKLTSSERRLISAFNLVSHALFARWHGHKLRVAVASAEVFREQFDKNGPCVTRLIIFVSRIYHGENLMNPKTYLTAASVPTPTLDELSQKLVCIYSAFDEIGISSVSKIMYILANRDGNESPELQKKLILLRQAGCILGGLNSQKLRRLGVEKLGYVVYEKVITHPWEVLFRGLDDNKARNKFHEVVKTIVGDLKTYKLLTRKQWNLIYGGIRGGYITSQLYDDARTKLGAYYDTVMNYTWGLELNKINDDEAARNKFHEVVKTIVGDETYKLLTHEQWNLIYGPIRSSQLYDDALTTLANGNVAELGKNQLSLLLNKRVDNDDVTDLQELLSTIQGGLELTDEQSAFLEGYYPSWNEKFRLLQQYKTEVYDEIPALNNTGTFHVLHEGNSTFKELNTDHKYDKYAGLNKWLMPQLKLFKKDNWRNDKEIIEILNLQQSSISSIRKCILNQRRMKLKEWWKKEFDAEFDPVKMNNVAREDEERVNRIKTGRRNTANWKK